MKKKRFLIRFVDGHEEKNIKAHSFSAAQIVAQYRRLERQNGIISHRETMISEPDCEIVSGSNKD